MFESIKRKVHDRVRDRLFERIDRSIADHKLKDGIDVVIAVSASDKRVKELDAQQQQLDLEREGVAFTSGTKDDFERRQLKLDKHRKKLKEDDALVRQYCALRYDVKAKSDASYPKGPTLVGDKEASFLLAVKDGKVLGGLRLNEVPAGKVPPLTGDIKESERPTPADKIVEARLENIFKDRGDAKFNRAEYSTLNIDGAFISDDLGGSDLTAALKMAVLQKLLEAVVIHAGTPGLTDDLATQQDKEKAKSLGYNSRSRYDMAYFVPAAVFAEPIEYFFAHNPALLQGKNALFVNMGGGTYTDRSGETKTRPVFGIILNDNIKKFVPETAKVLADYGDKIAVG